MKRECDYSSYWIINRVEFRLDKIVVIEVRLSMVATVFGLVVF